MRQILLIVFLLANVWALDYIYKPDKVLLAGKIRDKQILLTPDKLWILSGKYYLPVYHLPEKVNAAELAGEILLTDKYTITLLPAVKLTPAVQTGLRTKNPGNNYLLLEQIKNIYVNEDLDGDKVCEVIFRYDDKYYLASTNTEQIKQVIPIILNFSETENPPRFTFTYQSKTYAYEKRGLNWNRDTTEIYTPENLQHFKIEELEILRAVIEARKGRVFTNQRVQEYLQKQSWYQPDPQYTAERLTRRELQNIDIIFSVENTKLREGMYEYKTPQP